MASNPTGRAVRKSILLGMDYGASEARIMAQMASGLRPSDQRFRSFAERYMIERASTFREEHLAEDTWRCIMDAKRAYKQIEAVGRTITEEL